MDEAIQECSSIGNELNVDDRNEDLDNLIPLSTHEIQDPDLDVEDSSEDATSSANDENTNSMHIGNLTPEGKTVSPSEEDKTLIEASCNDNIDNSDPHQGSISPSSDLQVSHEFEFQRSTSLKEKENPFTRLSDPDTPDIGSDVTSIENKSVNNDNDFPKLKDIDLSKPEATENADNKPKSSPMVVSVGTIELNGSSQYEDINIMSKGMSIPEQPQSTNQGLDEPIDKNKDYESLRDLRFSSISMYDKPHFEEDIEIVVDDAQKHSAESFVSYKVVTKTTRKSFLQHEFHVRRRYQDFLWLSNILIQQFPSNIIPPLPQKKMFNKYDPNFLRLRQLALNKFLCRIAEHPILSTSEHFFAFLSAKQVELIEQKKTVAIKRFTIPPIPVSNVDSPFKSTSEFIEEFGKVLSSLSLHSTKLDSEQNELVAALNMLPPCIALWGNSEGDLEPILTKLGDATMKTSCGLETLIQTKEEIFTECIKEYQLYINTVRNVLKSRDHLQVTKEYYTETVLSKQKELEKLEVSEPGKSFATLFGKKPEQVKEERIDKLKIEITSLSADGEAAGDELEVSSASVRSDIERWKINKEKDCRNWLDGVAQAHVTYFEESAQLWESLLHFVDNTNQ